MHHKRPRETDKGNNNVESNVRLDKTDQKKVFVQVFPTDTE